MSATEADPVFGRQFSKAAAVVQVLGLAPETALLCQAGMGVAMHGGVGSGLLGCTSTHDGLTLSCELNNLPRQNS